MSDVEKIVTSRPSPYPGTAVISEDGRYRSILTRIIDPGNDRPLVVCGLNPSTATATDDDQTINKEIKFTKAWGCGMLFKVNAYDFRAREPDDMFLAKKMGAVISTKREHLSKLFMPTTNDEAIVMALSIVQRLNGILLVAWGNNIEPERQQTLGTFFGPFALCIATNKNGTPKHPLYLPDNSTYKPWRCP